MCVLALCELLPKPFTHTNGVYMYVCSITAWGWETCNIYVKKMRHLPSKDRFQTKKSTFLSVSDLIQLRGRNGNTLFTTVQNYFFLKI